ncbi:MAG: type IX secretion system membrane protein PorP/SprF [Saprospiraceae bacterium]|nr:type IX secretion system membrane protein PorP/SprF [Saprospiraceae bacterium]
MKKIIVLLLLTALLQEGFSQSDVHYSMFKLNRQIYNPAVTGENEALTFTSHYRDQWLKFPGAPRTFTFQGHAPFYGRNVGLGLSVVAEEIGMFKINMVSGSYAYHIRMENEVVLSAGLQGQLEHAQIRWEEVQATDPLDRIIGQQPSKLSGNVGAGIFLRKGEWYVGASMPRILNSKTYKDVDSEMQSMFSLRTYYFQAGTAFRLNKNFALQPGLLVAHNPSAPFEFDFNVNVLMFDRFGLGVAYRFEDSADAILQFKLSEQLKLAAGMDFTISSLQEYAPTSFELLVQYEFNFSSKGVHNIRFF